MSALTALGLPGAKRSLYAQGERVPEAAVVQGVPQGLFLGRSLLSGRAVCLLFLSGGRITRFIPSGGLESFDWAEHQTAHPGDSGRWEIAGGQLRIVWGDGGVHHGPLAVHPDGIEFYGKRYRKPVTVELADLAGQWESARGSAIAGGEGITRTGTFEIEADGRYRWVTTTGGTVAGRATGAEGTLTGRIALSSATILLRSDAGQTRFFTFIAVGGTPVTAFSLDADLFTRVR